MDIGREHLTAECVVVPDRYARQCAALLHVTDLVDAGSDDFSSYCYVIADMGWAWVDRTDVPDAVARALIDLAREWHDRPNALQQREVTLRVRNAIGAD